MAGCSDDDCSAFRQITCFLLSGAWLGVHIAGIARYSFYNQVPLSARLGEINVSSSDLVRCQPAQPKSLLGRGRHAQVPPSSPFLARKLLLPCPFQATPFEVFVLQEPCLLSPSPLLGGLWPLVGIAVAAMESARIVRSSAYPYLDCRCSQLGPCSPRVRFPCEGTPYLASSGHLFLCGSQND
jgi:hypothetical protein